ncbi:hypothetical protein F5148DRAFT_426302 [Russula earlei]|uniref:Uncharacterized protein n=1 Tax=Russula earlei TaxID=71964 RepID=A0ACC0TZT2_9AGAM|nr:hypothetical protein F5148DRAFT_426302 [Russula earlei]
MIPTLLARSRAAIIAAFFPNPQVPPQCASEAEPGPYPDPIDALVNESSLLELAEAIARKIPKHREAIGRDRLLDTVVARELLATEAVLLPALRTFAKVSSPLRPVNNVPREILSRIFALVGAGTEVVPLSHVCLRWRQIALRSPKLWTSIGDRDLTSMLPIFIERSQGAPLDVSVCIDSDDLHRLQRLANLQSASSHLRSFEVTISGSYTNGVKDVFSCFRSPAPLLTILSIRFDHDIKVPVPESSDWDDAFNLLFNEEHPALSSLSLKSLRPCKAVLSETLTTLTLASLCLSANDLYPCLNAAPNLTFLALLNVMSALSDDYTGTSDPISLDRLRTLYIHQPGGPYKHFGHLMAHLRIPRPNLACILMGECDSLDDDFASHLALPLTLSCAVTRLVLQLDGEPASKFYLHALHDDTFVLSLCLPTAALPQIFGRAPERISLGALCADTSRTTELVLRADGENQTLSAENLAHVFRRLPALEALVVTGTPLDGVVGALAALRDELQAPVLPRLRTLYVRGIGADALALMRYIGQRLEPGLPDSRVVCPAALKGSLGSRFGEVEAIEDLGISDFPKPLTVPSAMQEFLRSNLERNEWDWLMERNRWNWN